VTRRARFENRTCPSVFAAWVRRWLWRILLTLLISILLRWPTCADSQEKQTQGNALLNGDLVKGADGAPEFWNTKAYKTGPEFTNFTWDRVAAPASLEISSIEENDARWEQNARLAPGWYFFSAELRTEDVGPGGTGGCLSLIDHGVFVSRELRGSSDWQRVGFYLRATPKNDTADLACRLGGFGALNTGRLFCRQFKLRKISEPPLDGSPRFDLDVIRGEVAAGPAPGENAQWPIFAGIMCALLLFILIGQQRLGMAFRRWISHQSTEKDSWSTLDSVASSIRTGRFIDEWGAILASAAGTVVLSILAVMRLEGTPYSINIAAAIEGIKPLLPITAIAAIKLWSFWALCSSVVAALILQITPELDLLDALLAGASGVLVIAYLMGQALGPIGWFRPSVIWILVGTGVIQVARKPPSIVLGGVRKKGDFLPGDFTAPHPEVKSASIVEFSSRRPVRAMRPGEKCALLAFGLLTIGMLPLQLGSPVPPYMDVLSYPASVERILAFKVYLPFDNDPFGCWGARAQTPALELFYAALAMGAHVTQGILACSAVMLPMAAMVIFATYRMGLTLAGDSLGGIAALFLFFTNMFRRLPGMRGTAVDFALVALGLAFFFDRRRSRALLGLGSILLGSSVAGHAINGASAMLIAGLGLLLFLFDQDFNRFRASIVCLFGAVLIACPEVMIGLGERVIFPVLPTIQIVGILVILSGVRRLANREMTASEPFRLNQVPSAALLAISVTCIYFAAKGWIFQGLWKEFPILSLLAITGLIVWIVFTTPRLSTGSILVLFALSEAVLYLAVSGIISNAGGDVFRSGFADIGLKLEQYWCPYIMIFPAAVPFALLYHHSVKGRPLVVFGVLVLLIYPWYERFHVDYDYNEHSIAENWSIDLTTAAEGFWVTTPDSRWTLDSSGFALVDFLRDEQAKGRVTTQTHVLHLTHDVTPLGQFNRFSVFTGINDDPVVYEIPNADIVYGYLAGSRVRMVNELPQALAERPPYILEQVDPPPVLLDNPDGYDEVFHRGGLRLLRRKSS
jgi:hypothetical protein